MPLPPLIEICPPRSPVTAEVHVPGSKSITNRALVLAALAEGAVTLRQALWSEDTQVMVECLHTLGFEVTVTPEADEPCNRTITVVGRGGRIPRGGTAEQPLELFVGNAGTAARFLAAMVCLGKGVYRLSGVPRMHERPQAALFQALRDLGYTVSTPNNKLPAIIHGTGPRPGQCRVSIEESSQFASAFLLGADIGRWQVEVAGENAEESPYVAMTLKLIKAFPRQGGTFAIEPDCSSGSYFWAAQRLLPAGSRVEVANWPKSGWQMDEAFPQFVVPPAAVSRLADLGDSIMTAVVLAPFSNHPVRFTEMSRLRLQECDRVAALRTELAHCGANVSEEPDALTVCPAGGSLHGAAIETYHDHRMAMCFAILGLQVPGLKIQNPACVKKTFPNFFQKLAAPPPAGLGLVIQDGAGRKLAHTDLFAE